MSRRRKVQDGSLYFDFDLRGGAGWFAGTNLILTHILGPRKKTPVKQMPYESGMDPVGDARQPFDVKFYLVAILFLVFDVELLSYPWSVSAYLNEPAGAGIPVELRGTVYGVMLVFIAIRN